MINKSNRTKKSYTSSEKGLENTDLLLDYLKYTKANDIIVADWKKIIKEMQLARKFYGS